MIVWLASFPRSGNTFARIVLHRLYGVQTSTVYDLDGVAERLGAAAIGAVERTADYARMRACADLHFIKTHRVKDSEISAEDGCIHLVRDGRDALVSWARLNSEARPDQFTVQLRAMIERDPKRGTGSWGANVLSWLSAPTQRQALVHYEDLIEAPRLSITRAMAEAASSAIPERQTALPSFANLQAIDRGFFARGQPGAHHESLTGELRDLFWSRPDNAKAMETLGYGRDI